MIDPKLEDMAPQRPDPQISPDHGDAFDGDLSDLTDSEDEDDNTPGGIPQQTSAKVSYLSIHRCRSDQLFH